MLYTILCIIMLAAGTVFGIFWWPKLKAKAAKVAGG